ncbi:MAG: hypothetical protein WD688_26150 [Candidatus Binatia bacterium]
MKIVKSVAAIPIRLTPERVEHIERRHPEMLGQEERILEVVSSPDIVQEGDSATLIAFKHYSKTPLTEKYCAVVYRELSEEDGFVLTAYFTSKPSERRKTVWKP